MEVTSITLPAKGRNGEPILLMPVGDIQWSGDEKGVALKMLKRHIEWGVEHNAYFLGMGDYIDTLSPSNRQKLAGAGFYDTALKVWDKQAQDLTEEIYDKALAPSRGRWLGLLEGHHYHKFQSGVTTDQILADKLHTKFLGSNAYVRLRFMNHQNPGDVLIWCHHGVGTGSTSASVLNRLGRISQAFAADIYLMGHLHRKVAEPIDYTFPVYPPRGGEPVLVHRTRIMACTGSFLKGYVVGSREGLTPRGTYVEQKMLNPVALGGVVITIVPRWKDTKHGDLWVPDLTVSQ